jgi:hypothetical protein
MLMPGDLKMGHARGARRLAHAADPSRRRRRLAPAVST